MLKGRTADTPKRKTLYLWLLDLHLWCGLFVCPFVLLFAASTLLLNHGAYGRDRGSPADARTSEMPVEVPEGVDGVEQAKAVLRQVGVTGEIWNIFRRAGRLDIPVKTPGQDVFIRVNLETGVASVERRDAGFLDRLIYLHRSPGPHVVAIRGNWGFTRIWMWLVDGVVCGVLFLSASGIYLWTVLKVERRTGLVVMGLGTAAFFGLLAAVLHAG